MFKKITAFALAIGMMSCMAFANDYTVTTYTDGDKTITEGSITIESSEVNTRGVYIENVGLTPDDYGPWEHGVWFSDDFLEGYAFSYYMNPVFRHGSSARGSTGLVRSGTVARGETSMAESITYSIDGNKAYWNVEQ